MDNATVSTQRRFEHVEDYDYPNEHGELLLQKRRWKTDDERGKSFSYRSRTRADYPWAYYSNSKGVRYSKDFCPNADAIPYRLPQLLEAKAAGVPIIAWTEGEKDCNTFVAATGIPATTHHQGATRATLRQARWLEGYQGTVLVAIDWDIPGLACAERRYDLLRQIGIPTANLRLVRSRTARGRPTEAHGHDLTDHFQDSGTLDDLVPVSLRVVRRYAAMWWSEVQRHSNY